MNSNIKEKLSEINKFYSSFFENKKHFTYAYGSHITGYSKPNSDLDIVTICNRYSKKDIFKIESFIRSFHDKFNLEIDEEVPFEKKLIVKYDMMNSAVKGKGFHYEKKGSKIVPQLILTPEYLSSEELMNRLLLNTITGKSQLISGSKKDYLKYKSLGWKCIVKTIFQIENKSRITKSDFLELMIRKDNRVGREYMGYMDEVPVRKHLSNEIDNYFFKFEQQGLLKKVCKKYELS